MAESPFKPSRWRQVDPEGSFECFKKISNTDKVWLATDALNGGCFTAEGKDRFAREFHTWLNWVKSDDTRAQIWWHWLGEERKQKRDHGIVCRDEYIMKLWDSMDDPDGFNRKAREQIAPEFTWSFYQQHFFYWFLTRYNIINARRVYNKDCRENIHVPLSIISVLLVILYFAIQTHSGWFWILILAPIAVTFVVCRKGAKIPSFAFWRSLMPRMALTTGIGYLYLFSASGMVAVIYQNTSGIVAEMFISLAIALVVFLYTRTVISRRVHPRLKGRSLNMRAWHVMLMGITYSTIGLFICGPILFSKDFLGKEIFKNCSLDFQGYWLITAAIALAIGVALQLVWEDKPVTEPL